MTRLDMLLNEEEGEFDFRIEGELLFDKDKILRSRAHNTHAKLELINEEDELVYRHLFQDKWEREARVRLSGLEIHDRFYIQLTWSPEENELKIIPVNAKNEMRKKAIQ